MRESRGAETESETETETETKTETETTAHPHPLSLALSPVPHHTLSHLPTPARELVVVAPVYSASPATTSMIKLWYCHR